MKDFNKNQSDIAEQNYIKDHSFQNLKDFLLWHDRATGNVNGASHEYEALLNARADFLIKLDKQPSTDEIKKFSDQVRYVDGDVGPGIEHLAKNAKEAVELLESNSLEILFPLSDGYLNSRKLVEKYINSQISQIKDDKGNTKYPELELDFLELKQYVAKEKFANLPKDSKKFPGRDEIKTNAKVYKENQKSTSTKPHKEVDLAKSLDLLKDFKTEEKLSKRDINRITKGLDGDTISQNISESLNLLKDSKLEDGLKYLKNLEKNEKILTDNNGKPLSKGDASRLLTQVRNIGDDLGLKLNRHTDRHGQTKGFSISQKERNNQTEQTVENTPSKLPPEEKKAVNKIKDFINKRKEEAALAKENNKNKEGTPPKQKDAPEQSYAQKLIAQKNEALGKNKPKGRD